MRLGYESKLMIRKFELPKFVKTELLSKTITSLTSGKPKLKEVISEIHQKLDAVYVFGIGSKIDIEELKLMASKVCSAFFYLNISVGF